MDAILNSEFRVSAPGRYNIHVEYTFWALSDDFFPLLGINFLLPVSSIVKTISHCFYLATGILSGATT